MKTTLSRRLLVFVGTTILVSSVLAYVGGSAVLETGAKLSLTSDLNQALETGRDALVEWRKERQAWAAQLVQTCSQSAAWPNCLPAAARLDDGNPGNDAEVAGLAAGPPTWLDDNHYRLFRNSAAGLRPYVVSFSWAPIRPRFDQLSEALKTGTHLAVLWGPLLYSLNLVFIGMLVLAALSALLVLWLLTRGLARRIAALTAYATKLSSGALLTPPPTASVDDELGLLTSTMASMASSLATATKRLVFQEKMASWQLVARKMAHEIKNPLTPISLVGEQLARYQKRAGPDLAPVLAEASRVLLEETAFLSRMVREFSHFARLPEPQLRPCELTELVADFLHGERENPAARLTFAPAVASAPVLADRGMLLQILRNLLHNAIRAKGDTPVHVQLELATTADGYALLFQDDGPGVLPALEASLFDAYVTSRSTGEAEKGMGLGLTISRKIAHEHRGSLTLARTGAQGSSFRLELPRLAGEMP